MCGAHAGTRWTSGQSTPTATWRSGRFSPPFVALSPHFHCLSPLVLRAARERHCSSVVLPLLSVLEDSALPCRPYLVLFSGSDRSDHRREYATAFVFPCLSLRFTGADCMIFSALFCRSLTNAAAIAVLQPPRTARAAAAARPAAGPWCGGFAPPTISYESPGFFSIDSCTIAQLVVACLFVQAGTAAKMRPACPGLWSMAAAAGLGTA